MRERGLLSCFLRQPVSIADLTEITSRISAGCGSAGMIFAMHQAQIVVLRRHGTTADLRKLATEAAVSELLVASCTTEESTGGDIARSTCAVEPDGDIFRLEKRAPVISYGEEADVVFTTARRHPDASPDDQVLVACRASYTKLTRTMDWDAMGMRGTCSHGFVLNAEGQRGHIFPVPYSEIASQTEVAVTQTLWAAVWRGIAAEALTKTIDAIQRRTPRSGSTAATLTDVRLAEARRHLMTLDALVRQSASKLDSGIAPLLGAVDSNHLKLSASESLVDITHSCLRLVGMEGYLNTGKFSLSRHIRDALSSPLMISNERLLLNNARVARTKLGLPK